MPVFTKQRAALWGRRLLRAARDAGPWAALVLLVSCFLGGCAAPDGRREAPRIASAVPGPAATPPDGEQQEEQASLPVTAAAEPAAALVNGEVVLLAEYEAQVAAAEDAMIEQGLDPDSLEGQDQLAQLRTDVLDLLIDRTLISQAAAAMGIAVSETELATRVAADIEVGGGQAAFEEWLQTTGQSQSNYTEIVRLALLEQRVFEAVTADVGEQNEQVRASHIQVASAEAAQEILDLLRGGADFGELAVQWSMDETTRDSGGDLGWIPRGVLARELEDVAFSLKPGEVGGPVQVGAAFHVIKVLEQEAARPLSPEMQLTLRQAAFEEWLAGRRSSAIIERVAGD